MLIIEVVHSKILSNKCSVKDISLNSVGWTRVGLHFLKIYLAFSIKRTGLAGIKPDKPHTCETLAPNVC